MKRFLILMLALVLCLSAFAACGNKTDDETKEPSINADTEQALKNATAYVKNMYKYLLTENTTASDFAVITMVKVSDVDYTVTWSVNNDSIKVVAQEGDALIDIDEKATEAIEYELTAVVSAADGTKGDPLTFKLVVPAYALNTWDEYAAAAKDTPLVVQGVVSGIISKSTGASNNCLYIQDNVGGYYIYGMEADPVEAGIKVGMTVEAKGAMDIYNGTLELKNASVTIVDSTIKVPTPVDYTDLYKNAASLKDAALVAKQGLLVTIKGAELVAQSDSDVSGGYYRFKIGNQASSYVRISSSTCPLNADEQATFKAAFADHIGYTADVTGVICVYDGAFYLTPVSADAFANFTAITRTDAEKAQFELDNLKFDAKITSDKVIDLAAAGSSYADVAITWTSDNAAAVVADGKLTVTVPDDEITVTITATAKCGNETKTREFKVTLSKSIVPLKEATEIGAAKEHNTYTDEKYLIAGVVTEVQNDKYGNLLIKDETGTSLLVYGTYNADGSARYDALEKKPVVGDYIVVLGILGQYNGTAQMKNGWLVSHIAPLTIPAANELGNTFGKNEYTTDKHVITGKITEVQSDKYGNVMIADEAGNSILVYGLYSSNGATRYDAMTTKPVVGDTITVLGIIGKYNDPQMKNGWLIGHTAAAGEGGEGTEGGETSTADASIAFPTSTRTSFDATTAEVWEANGIKVTHSKGSNDLRDNLNDTSLRVYGGATLKVECAGMTKVVVVPEAGYSSNADRLSSVTADAGTVEVVDGKIVITFAAATDVVTITNGHTSQVRITSIEITK